jgi:predicted RNA polymerase sigma factor
MAQRISRAKQQIREAGACFTLPGPAERDQRSRAVQQVLYLIFNEGYTASAGERLQRTDLAAEGIRLAQLLRVLLPGDAETAGLLALMLLTDARRAARTSVEETDWAEVLALYQLLDRVSPGPMVSLGRAVAIAMVHGPRAGLAATGELAAPLGRHHRFHAVRGHLHEMAGDRASAAEDYRTAAKYATNLPEKRYLERKLAALRAPSLAVAYHGRLPSGAGVADQRWPQRVPVGPSSGSVARCTATDAPSAAVRKPLWPLRSVAQ